MKKLLWIVKKLLALKMLERRCALQGVEPSDCNLETQFLVYKW